jgi:hypothetical protein
MIHRCVYLAAAAFYLAYGLYRDSEGERGWALVWGVGAGLWVGNAALDYALDRLDRKLDGMI